MIDVTGLLDLYIVRMLNINPDFIQMFVEVGICTEVKLNGRGNGFAFKRTHSVVKELYKSVPILWEPEGVPCPINILLMN